MEKILYNLSIAAYSGLIQVFSLFNPKAKQWIKGRKDIFEKLEDAITKNTTKLAWFHCASLGEFEQGRPLLERFSSEFPEFKILLTFFSPSGYEIRKNYAQADYIFYLPMDSDLNARRFVTIVKPSIVFFVKYEFWYHYISEIKKHNIPLISVSAIFRKDQLFFKSYGNFYARILKSFDHIFVQNKESQNLLERIGYTSSTVTGDTRFDRVKQIASSIKEIPDIEKFIQNLPVLVAGSTWQGDMDILVPFINNYEKPLKIIIAPHEINPSVIDRLIQSIEKKAIKFSQVKLENVANFDVLIIDNIGMLSSLYHYAGYAYIGGGFGKGIHNILEAVVHGIPVFFGPNFQKFKEANDLVKLLTAFSVNSREDFEKGFDVLYEKVEKLKIIKEMNKKYIEENAGATEKIMEYCKRVSLDKKQ